ncbi:E3 ubiquitin-protein ligase Topors-like [Argiope bruennichi]|uniref:E3 ubiquitin-protein ligase Topors n=1 Tax=Argiope bruennichi TaxID=94029 RepID=A0A8T0ENA0_ARGBR|nr:E3 ubiquitin-protein ligase Topors-like [Argiope bruennichi]XP_055946046.1 E3 ubiquitin-protein ligase Topors-like [Argiope bruennichi]KAF8777270.1 E3 ubiquitin-protein ligase Topors like protein [Argiope bruennichi]
MEQKSDENSSFKTGSKQHVLKEILCDKDTQKSNSTADSSNKNSEESKKKSSDANERSSEEDNIERPSSTNSPEPNCPICLEPLQNKSFTDSCCHQFCFTCLLEWSKVKAECPLCKQQFKSIVHNLQKDNSFEEYVIGTKTGRYLSYFRAEQERFRYPTTMTPSRIAERNRYQESYQSQIASHRMRFAPHSVNLYSGTQIMSRRPCPFRRRVYEQNLWVKTPRNDRTRVATPEFYKSNPACTHRLIPWLNRELVSLWQENDATVSFILELIMSLLVRYHINSQEFLIHIEPYMGRHTHHFIHEFHAFAISPYDMENYDAHADYGLVRHSTDDADRSSPDSDVIPIFTEENTSVPRQSRERKQNMRHQTLKHLKLILKKNGGNSWESYLSPPSTSFMSSSSWSNPGPSTSGFRPNNCRSVDGNTSNLASVSDVEQTDDDEIQILSVRKRPPRNPVIVDLSSDEEADLAVVIDVSSDEENFSPLYSPSKTPPEEGSDIECLLEYQPSTSINIPGTIEISTEKDKKMEEEQEQEDEHHNSSVTEEFESDISTEEDKPPKLASAIVRPWAMKSKSSHKVYGSSQKRYWTSSGSDSGDPRLKSVVTGYVPEHENDHHHSGRDHHHHHHHHHHRRHESSHRSSHKKHKEKKKKKKHKRQKMRIYSDTE